MRAILLILLLLTSCATKKQGQSKSSGILLKQATYQYVVRENSGEYVLERQNGWRSRNNFVSKRFLKDYDNGKELEKSISISKTGTLKNGVRIMRPEVSQYVVWFDKKKYVSTTKIKDKSKSIEVKLSSPEKRWNGVKNIPFPSTSSVYCYFYQIVECMANMGYIEKAAKVSQMVLDLYIVWEGYPFIQEQYAGIPNEVFTKATFSYDGLTDRKEHKYSLRFGEEMIAFVVDKNYQSYRMFWVSQGLSMIMKSAR